uniref:Uncharacterized protein n=1 Tax=Anopheles maculatus TaxID=74869 RepID=A0A182TAD8_9DIPT
MAAAATSECLDKDGQPDGEGGREFYEMSHLPASHHGSPGVVQTATSTSAQPHHPHAGMGHHHSEQVIHKVSAGKIQQHSNGTSPSSNGVAASNNNSPNSTNHNLPSPHLHYGGHLVQTTTTNGGSTGGSASAASQHEPTSRPSVIESSQPMVIECT